uniref:Uncharacterized protein n=1 Tax=Arundo donax TaxID=35708 RepID=A0A0A8YQM0_ARUDO
MLSPKKIQHIRMSGIASKVVPGAPEIVAEIFQTVDISVFLLFTTHVVSGTLSRKKHIFLP